MKMTNMEIYNIAKGLMENFQDNSQYLPIKINFFIQRNKKTLFELAQIIDDSRVEIIKHYGTANEEDGTYIIPTESIPVANKEIEDLFNLEQEVSIAKINIESFPDDISLTTGQMEALLFMIEES